MAHEPHTICGSCVFYINGAQQDARSVPDVKRVEVIDWLSAMAAR